MTYSTWTKKELFNDFITGFYFIKIKDRSLSVIELRYGFDGSKIYKNGSGTNHLALLSEKALFFGPIPTPHMNRN